jgi:hypothetical protein
VRSFFLSLDLGGRFMSITRFTTKIFWRAVLAS